MVRFKRNPEVNIKCPCGRVAEVATPFVTSITLPSFRCVCGKKGRLEWDRGTGETKLIELKENLSKRQKGKTDEQ